MIDIKDLIHPGEILLEEFIRPFDLSQNKLATGLSVPISRINAIVQGRKPVTADIALRLSEYFGTSVNFWMNLQNNYDLCVAKANREKEKQSRKSKIVPS